MSKQVLERVYREVSKGNTQPLLDSLADDVQWTIIGSTELSGIYHGRASCMADLHRFDSSARRRGAAAVPTWVRPAVTSTVRRVVAAASLRPDVQPFGGVLAGYGCLAWRTTVTPVASMAATSSASDHRLALTCTFRPNHSSASTIPAPPPCMGKHRPGHRLVHHRGGRHHHRPRRLQHLPQGGAAALPPVGPAPLCQHCVLAPAPRGGHFAAWEQPGLFTGEIRAAARSCALSPRYRNET